MAKLLSNPKTKESQLSRVYVCSSPADYTRMFSMDLITCMTMPTQVSGVFPFDLVWQDMKKMHGIHPASWYHFQPYAAGFYVELASSTNTILMRGMIYRDPEVDGDGPWREYGDVKTTEFFDNMATMPEIITGVLQTFAFNGIVRPVKDVATRCTYTVPGYPHPTWGLLCPLAHCDNQLKDFAVTFDSANKKFVFHSLTSAPMSALMIKDTYTFQGYITEQEAASGRDRDDVLNFMHYRTLKKYVAANDGRFVKYDKENQRPHHYQDQAELWTQ